MYVDIVRLEFSEIHPFREPCPYKAPLKYSEPIQAQVRPAKPLQVDAFPASGFTGVFRTRPVDGSSFSSLAKPFAAPPPHRSSLAQKVKQSRFLPRFAVNPGEGVLRQWMPGDSKATRLWGQGQYRKQVVLGPRAPLAFVLYKPEVRWEMPQGKQKMSSWTAGEYPWPMTPLSSQRGISHKLTGRKFSLHP